MSARIDLAAPSPSDSRRGLWRKLCDPGAWSDAQGRPDTILLARIKKWPSCWPALASWIDGILTNPRIQAGDPPRPPRELVKERFAALRSRARTRRVPKPRRPRGLEARKTVTPPPLPPAEEDGTVDDLAHTMGEEQPKVARTLSWQNVRRPLVIVLAAILTLAAGASAVAVMRGTVHQQATISRRNDLASAVELERRRTAETQLRKSIRDAESAEKLSVSDPERISRLKATVSKAKNALKSRRIALTEFSDLRKSLERQTWAVRKQAEEKKTADERKQAAAGQKAEADREAAERKQAQADAQAKAQAQAQAEQKVEAERSAEQQRERQEAARRATAVPRSTPTAPRRMYGTAPRRSYVPNRRSAAPSQQSGQSSSQTWSVPSQGCTEGCL